MNIMRFLRQFLILAALFAAAPELVRAHGRTPETYQFLVDPSDSDRWAVASTFGLLLSDDGGGSWRWVCRQALEIALIEDPPFAFTSDGSLAGAIFDGVIRSESDGCEWTFPSPDLDQVVVTDIELSPTGEIFAIQSASGVSNALFAGDESGTTWTATGEPIDDTLFNDIAVSPSDPSRIYLNAIRPRIVEEDVRMPFVYRSSDGGVTFERFDFPFEEDERDTALLAVSPIDSNVLFLRAVRDRDAPAKLDRLARSDDGGENWTSLLDVPDLQGFAISDDGQEIWVGGKKRSAIAGPDGVPVELGQGLWYSDDAGESFEQLDDEKSISCLALHNGELYACAVDPTDGFALGRSADGGRSFEPVLLYTEIAGPVECNEGEPTPTTCESEDRDIAFDFALPGTPLCIDRMGTEICRDGGVPLDDAGSMDAGADPEDPGSSGCGCRVNATRGSGCIFLVLLLTFALVWRRRRAFGQHPRGTIDLT